MDIQAYSDPEDLPASEPARVARLLAIDEPHTQRRAACPAGSTWGSPGGERPLAEVLGRSPGGRAGGSRRPSGRAQSQETSVQGTQREALREWGGSSMRSAAPTIWIGMRSTRSSTGRIPSWTGKRRFDMARSGSSAKVDGSGPQPHSPGRGRHRPLMTPRTLRETLRAYRIGDPAGRFPAWSAEGAKRTSGRLRVEVSMAAGEDGPHGERLRATQSWTIMRSCPHARTEDRHEQTHECLPARMTKPHGYLPGYG